jgi:26S proteasome regulatory subunit T4
MSSNANDESQMANTQEQSEREQVLEQYRAKIREHREVEARLKRMRENVKDLVARYQKTEDDLSALQSVGQIIGDVLKRLDSDRFIVKASSGPRYVVGCRTKLNHEKLLPGTRVALDMTTLTIMRILPREVDPTVFHMKSGEEDGGVSFSDIGGLNDQIRELREVIELPLTNPELFIRVGIKVRFNNFKLSMISYY